MILTQDQAARLHRFTAFPSRGGRTGSCAGRDRVKASAFIQADPAQAVRVGPNEAAVARLVYRTCRCEYVTAAYLCVAFNTSECASESRPDAARLYRIACGAAI